MRVKSGSEPNGTPHDVDGNKGSPLPCPAIGCLLQSLQSQVIDCERRLNGVVDAHTRDTLERTSAELTGRVYRIAVIGQMKAGKSSLINALIRRPDLIPIDVNPWTAVMTRLHFCEQQKSDNAMVFTFFDEKEWKDLSENGGMLGSLAMRLVPELNQDELFEQLAEMRERARQRLGTSFEQLLGQRHQFSQISKEVIQRYVCAGQPPASLQRIAAPGRFADITRSADIFLNTEPFACPAVLLDTPGTNDPFLVRDAITHQQLGEADVHIVVMNAQQALSTADLTLLRVLHGLHKDRIVVFINRIDVLGDIAEHSHQIVDNIISQLSKEFPGTTIPVIAGSAYWGEQVMAGDEQQIREAAGDPQLVNYAHYQAVLDDDQATSWRKAAPTDLEEIKRVLLQCSGIAALSEEISELMLAGPGRHAVTSAVTAMTAIARGAEASVINELRALETMGKAAKGNVEESRSQLQTLQEDVDRLTTLGEELKRMEETLNQDLGLMKDVGLQRLQTELDKAVMTFASSEALKMEELGQGERVWRCDTRPLRQTLEHLFLTRYRQLAEELLTFQSTTAANLRTRLDHVVPGYDIEVGYESPHLIDPSPSIAALGKIVALDLGRPWAEWWRLWRTSAFRVDKLKALIASEFRPVAETLVLAAKMEMDKHAEQASNRFCHVVESTVQALRQRQTRLIVVYKSLLEDRRERPEDEVLQSHAERMAACHEQLERYRLVQADLDKLLDETNRDRGTRALTSGPGHSILRTGYG